MNTQHNGNDSWGADGDRRGATNTNPAYIALEWNPSLRGEKPTKYFTAYRADTCQPPVITQSKHSPFVCTAAVRRILHRLFADFHKRLRSSVCQFACFPPRIIDTGRNRIWWRLVFRIWWRLVFRIWWRLVFRIWWRLVFRIWWRFVFRIWWRLVFRIWWRLVFRIWWRLVFRIFTIIYRCV